METVAQLWDKLGDIVGTVFASALLFTMSLGVYADHYTTSPKLNLWDAKQESEEVTTVSQDEQAVAPKTEIADNDSSRPVNSVYAESKSGGKIWPGTYSNLDLGIEVAYPKGGVLKQRIPSYYAFAPFVEPDYAFAIDGATFIVAVSPELRANVRRFYQKWEDISDMAQGSSSESTSRQSIVCKQSLLDETIRLVASECDDEGGGHNFYAYATSDRFDLLVVAPGSVTINNGGISIKFGVFPEKKLRSSYESPNGKSRFDIYGTRSYDACTFTVFDSEGKIVPIDLGYQTIYCDGDVPSFSSFRGWIDDSHFVVTNQRGDEVKVVDMSSRAVQTFRPTTENLTYRAVDSSLGHWIFREWPEGELFLLDEGLNVVTPIEASGRSSGRGVLYDSANIGLVFIWAIYGAKETSYKLDFLSLVSGSYELKTILETKPHYVPGRGCDGAERLLSVPGEIIFSPSCQRFPPEYVSADGYVHVKLTQ